MILIFFGLKEIQKKVARTSQRKKRLMEARELDLEVENKRLEVRIVMRNILISTQLSSEQVSYPISYHDYLIDYVRAA